MEPIQLSMLKIKFKIEISKEPIQLSMLKIKFKIDKSMEPSQLKHDNNYV